MFSNWQEVCGIFKSFECSISSRYGCYTGWLVGVVANDQMHQTAGTSSWDGFLPPHRYDDEFGHAFWIPSCRSFPSMSNWEKTLRQTQISERLLTPAGPQEEGVEEDRSMQVKALMKKKCIINQEWERTVNFIYVHTRKHTQHRR